MGWGGVPEYKVVEIYLTNLIVEHLSYFSVLTFGNVFNKVINIFVKESLHTPWLGPLNSWKWNYWRKGYEIRYCQFVFTE